MALTSGTVLGRYRLMERLGSGGMSDVWRAQDETLQRTVAVKIMHEPIAQSREFVERFLREARVVAGLEHPNILPIYDFGSVEVGGSTISFLVMPVVAGSLRERMLGPVPPAVALPWIAAVGAALDHSHAKGILHRDVKPANVLMDSSGRPMLADFGLARSMETVSGLTQTGAVLGTPWYMAPEQAMGEHVDRYADQYALAVTAFQMLAGKPPFRADTPMGVLHQHISVVAPPFSSMSPSGTSIRPEVDAVFSRALAKDPAKRFPSCADFAVALATAYGVSISAAPAPYPTGPPPGAPAPSRAAEAPSAPGAAPPVASLPTVMMAPTDEATSRGITAPPSMKLAPPPARWKVGVAAAALLLIAGAGLFLALRPAASPRGEPGKEAAPTPAVPTAVAAEPTVPPPPTAALPEPTEVPTPPAELPTAAPPPTPRRIAERSETRRDTEPRRDSGPRRDTSVPREDSRPMPRPEPLLGSAALSADTSLAGAYDSLDSSRKPKGRLERMDFVSAMGDARRAMSTRDSAEVRFLDGFSRAGVAFADGQNAQAWQLLRQSLGEAPRSVSSRKLRFVRSVLPTLGANPGVDGNWLMGLAFADVRGDVDEELQSAAERAPNSARVAYARALHALDVGNASEARRLSRRACEDGLAEACELAGR